MCCADVPEHGSKDGVILRDPTDMEGGKSINDQPASDWTDNPFTDTFASYTKRLAANADKYAPLEDRVISMRERFGSPAYQQEQINAAKGDVASAFSRQRAASDADAASLGLDPTNPRRAAMNRSLDMAQAAATANAGTTARRLVERQDFDTAAALSTRGDAKMDQALKAASVGGDLYSKGQEMDLRQYMQGRDIDLRKFLQWRDLQYNKDKTDQQAEDDGLAGIGSIVGTIGGILLSSRDAKTRKGSYRGGREAIRQLPMDRWAYKKGQGDEGEHVGTYAEDFQKATGSGDGKHIPVVDAVGVTMAAVKELDNAVQRIERRLP